MNDTRKTSTTYAAVFADGTPASPEYLSLDTATARAKDVGAGYMRTTVSVVTEVTNALKKSTFEKKLYADLATKRK